MYLPTHQFSLCLQLIYSPMYPYPYLCSPKPRKPKLRNSSTSFMSFPKASLHFPSVTIGKFALAQFLIEVRMYIETFFALLVVFSTKSFKLRKKFVLQTIESVQAKFKPKYQFIPEVLLTNSFKIMLKSYRKEVGVKRPLRLTKLRSKKS